MGALDGPMRSCSLSLHDADVSEARKIFEALSASGTVVMPFDETFWAKGFGMLTDLFGASLDGELRVTRRALPSTRFSGA